MIEALVVGELYSNEDIFKSLKVSNAGGIRFSLRDKAVLRAAIMTSVQDLHGAGENPYHDRLEGGILTYTAAGKLGQQTLAGVNNRLLEQRTLAFPIHGFVLIASRRDKSVGPKRWKYLGCSNTSGTTRISSSTQMARFERSGFLNSGFTRNKKSCRWASKG
jgi:hypothetical protein